MLTVFFYNLILLLSTFLIYLSERIRDASEKFLIILLAFLLVFIPSAIRYDIGTDFLSYINIYDNLEDYASMEPGFYYINKFLKGIGAHQQWLIGTLSFLFTFICFRSYPKKNAWVIHFVVLSLIYLSSFNVIRQALAIVICLWALRLFLNNRMLAFLLVSFISTLFHKSAVFFIFVVLLSTLPIKDSLKSYFLPVLFLPVLFFLFFKSNDIFVYFEIILRVLSFDEIANYFSNNNRHFVVTELGTGLGVLSKLLFSLFFILNTKYIIALNKRNWVVVLLVYAYIISLILSAQIVLFSRATYIFTVALPYAVYLLISIDKNKNLNKIVVFLFSLIILFSFIKESFGVPSSYGDPKFNPYQVFFIQNE